MPEVTFVKLRCMERRSKSLPEHLPIPRPVMGLIQAQSSSRIILDIYKFEGPFSY